MYDWGCHLDFFFLKKKSPFPTDTPVLKGESNFIEKTFAQKKQIN